MRNTRKELPMMTISEVVTNRRRNGGTALVLGMTSVSLLVVGWAWDHQYVPLLFAAAPIVAVAGLIFAAVSLRRSRDVRSAVPALVGGGLSLLVLLGYVYALFAYAGGGN
jgi:hypothetical protein